MLKFTFWFIVTYFVLYWLTDLYIKSWDGAKTWKFLNNKGGKNNKLFRIWLSVLSAMSLICILLGCIAAAQWLGSR